MFNNEWLVAGALLTILAIGLLLPKRRPKNDRKTGNGTEGKLS